MVRVRGFLSHILFCGATLLVNDTSTIESFQVQETDVAGSVPTSFCREGLEFTSSCRVECSCCTIPCYEN